MRSRAQFKAHPIHPALIPFPFAFLAGTLPFDALGMILGRPGLGLTGAYLTLAGLGAGLVAAIPGAIDYLYTVPPESSAKRRATQHAAGNLVALALFGTAFALRTDSWQPGLATLGLEFLGTGVLLYSGWLGGTLVTRNLISVDHRYAQAGKWQEAQLSPRGSAPLVVGHVDDLKESQMKLLHVNGRRLVLARTSEGYRAFEDRCTHRGGSLAGGVLICGTVQCLWHGSQFDVSTGAVTCGPARKSIRAYELEEKKNGQLVLVSPPE
jgi:nitrite reductase/ring-hydroxylating ferredoxin subunit/uncharacterized membrane protein